MSNHTQLGTEFMYLAIKSAFQMRADTIIRGVRQKEGYRITLYLVSLK
jgi:hypothetical protein